MNNLENAIKELKDLGFTKEQVAEVLEIAEKEIMDVILEDFALNADEEKLEEYKQKFDNAQKEKDAEKFSKILHEIIGIQYGEENIEKKKEELLVVYLQKIANLTKETTEVYKKYSQGDPEAKKIIEETENSPIVQHVIKEMEKEGLD